VSVTVSSRTLRFISVLFVVVAYGQSLNYPFVYDDLPSILDDPLISHAAKLADAFRAWFEPWRPVTRFSYALTHVLVGFSKPAFHGTNLIIHLINTLLVFEIAIRLGRRWLSDVDPKYFAFGAATIHAVHPLYTEAVTYVSGRSSSLCALFYFASLLFLVMGLEGRDAVRRVFWFFLSAASGVLALEAKEEAITLPFILAILLMLAGRRKPAFLLVVLPCLMLILRWHAFSLLYQSSAANQTLVSIGVGTPVRAMPYVLSEIKAAVFYYLGRLLIPAAQSVDPYFRPVETILDPGFLAAVVILGLLIAAAVHLRTRQPIVTFAIAALLVSPLLAYAAIPLADIVAEHRIYISGLGVDLAFAWLLTQSRRLMGPALIMLGLALTLATISRNSVWASDLRLWQQAEANSQTQVRPHLNLGVAYQVDGQLSRALVEYERALAIRPDLPLVYMNMGTIYLKQSRILEAEPVLKRAIELLPSMPQPYIDLASIAVTQRKPDLALSYVAKAEKVGAEPCWAHFIKAEALALSEQSDAAVAEYQAATTWCATGTPLSDEIQHRLSGRPK
jgi:tetratricopeptide (TPR) repeat protein